MKKTNYSEIADTYNKRYNTNYLSEIESELAKLASSNNCLNILEAGCGTCRWIKTLDDNNKNVFGLDYSIEMLRVAKLEIPTLKIINADAVNFPYKNNCFDLIFCVNAIHHFPDKKKFISECKRTLKPGGVLAVFGVDPHKDKDWYVYKYFDRVLENDLKRFISSDSLTTLLNSGEFNEAEIKTAEKVYNERKGSEVFDDPFLEKYHSSQLANLSDSNYKKGIEKIKIQIKKYPETIFRTAVIFYLVSARKRMEN